MIDVAAQGEEAFEGVCDVSFDLLRRHSAVERRDHDHGNFDLRKQVYRHASYGCRSHHDNHQAQHQDEERIFDSETGHCYLLFPAAKRSRSSLSASWFPPAEVKVIRTELLMPAPRPLLFHGASG